MRAYDLHVHSAFSIGESTVEQLAQAAKSLGYSGIGFTVHWKDERQLEITAAETEKIGETVGIDILVCVEARNVRELRRLAEIRRMFDILVVRGGDLELNRAATETPEVDILAHPGYGRTDSGLNHVLARLAARNNVAIEVNFREILMSSDYSRARILKNIRQNVMLAKKYGVPLILCSGAVSHFELRDPYSMVSMAVQLGLGLNEAKEGISRVPERIIGQAKERRGGGWVMPGVRVVGRKAALHGQG